MAKWDATLAGTRRVRIGNHPPGVLVHGSEIVGGRIECHVSMAQAFWPRSPNRIVQTALLPIARFEEFKTKYSSPVSRRLLLMVA
jgi:hypothetical protein